MTAPTWFVIIGVILLIIYIIDRVLSNTITNIKNALKGEGSGGGCLLKTVVGFFSVILVIWYLITELL